MTDMKQDADMAALIQQRRLSILDRLEQADPTDPKVIDRELQTLRDLEHPILVNQKQKSNEKIGENHTQAILAQLELQRQSGGGDPYRVQPAQVNAEVRQVQGLNDGVPLIEGVKINSGEFEVGSSNTDYEQFAKRYNLNNE